jgi:hypothetical protein
MSLEQGVPGSNFGRRLPPLTRKDKFDARIEDYKALNVYISLLLESECSFTIEDKILLNLADITGNQSDRNKTLYQMSKNYSSACANARNLARWRNISHECKKSCDEISRIAYDNLMKKVRDQDAWRDYTLKLMSNHDLPDTLAGKVEMCIKERIRGIPLQVMSCKTSLRNLSVRFRLAISYIMDDQRVSIVLRRDGEESPVG